MDDPQYKPDWYTGDDWSQHDDWTAKLYKETFGRDIDAGAMAEYRAQKRDSSHHEAWRTLRKHWASSDGSQIDPASVGVDTVDPSSLSDKEKPFYDIWKGENPNTPFLDTHREQLRWQAEAADDDPRLYEAEVAGEVVKDYGYNEEDGNFFRRSWITPAAIARMGGSFVGSGNRLGDVFMLPTGTSLEIGGNFQSYQDLENGYTVLGARGNPDEGLLGDTFVGDFVDKAMPDEYKALVDPLGIGGPILFGREFSDAQYKGFDNLGVNKETVDEVRDVTRPIAQSAMAFYGGPAGFAAASAMEASNAKAATVKYNQLDSSDAFEMAAKGTAMLAANYAIPGAANNFAKNASVAAGTSATRAASMFSAAASATYTISEGGTFGDAAEGYAYGRLGATGQAIRYAVDDDYDTQALAIGLGNSVLHDAIGNGGLDLGRATENMFLASGEGTGTERFLQKQKDQMRSLWFAGPERDTINPAFATNPQ